MAVFLITLLAVDTAQGQVLWQSDTQAGFLPSEDSRYRALPQNRGYLDLAAILTRDEVRQVATDYFAAQTRMVEASAAKILVAPFAERAKTLLDQIDATPQSDHVFFFVRYWEMVSESFD